MSSIWSIYKREIKSYFVSPVAYVVMAIFFGIIGFQFYHGVAAYRDSSVYEGILGLCMFVFLFIAPLLTMRLIAEEKKTGTIELLLTSPITPAQIILGKFFAAMTLVMICIIGTLFYVVLIMFNGSIEIGPLFSGYLGLVFITSVFVSIGLVTTSISESQIVAGILGFGISIIMILLHNVAGSTQGTLGTILKEFMPTWHYTDFGSGVIDFKHIVYFLLWIVFSLSISVKSLEAKLLR
ncbi:MAG: ABC transporter permease [Spirochaetes bacterium]|nr:ABC transporter permease [Spirochaetota bacterium]MCK5267104.1 ABC transporter permease [Spirochaetota bacterium]